MSVRSLLRWRRLRVAVAWASPKPQLALRASNMILMCVQTHCTVRDMAWFATITVLKSAGVYNTPLSEDMISQLYNAVPVKDATPANQVSAPRKAARRRHASCQLLAPAT